MPLFRDFIIFYGGFKWTGMITNGIAVLSSFTAPVFPVTRLAMLVYRDSGQKLFEITFLGTPVWGFSLRDPGPQKIGLRTWRVFHVIFLRWWYRREPSNRAPWDTAGPCGTYTLCSHYTLSRWTPLCSHYTIPNVQPISRRNDGRQGG